MKHQFLVIIILLALSTAAFAQFTGDANRGNKPRGKIDSIVETRYKFSDNDTIKKPFIGKFVYIFNDKGQLVKSTEHWLVSYFTLVSFYSYDEAGYITEKHVESLEKKTEAAIPFSKTTYYYTPSHQSVKADYRQFQRPDFPTDFTDDIELDQSGNMLRDSTYLTPFEARRPKPAEISHRRNYHYNSKGYLIELNDFPLGLHLQTTISYDGNGNITESLLVGRAVLYKKYPNAVSTYNYTYNYSKLDNKQNWLVKNEYLNGRLNCTTERSISYSK